jgi:D-alanyl-D-alanine carboxypeptidase (penicillin-binding protein 5/6)
MRRHQLACFVAVVGLALLAAPAHVFATPVQQPTPPPPPLAKQYVLVDADTGAVLAQQDAHTAVPPASTIKLLTALIASQRVAPNDQVPITPLADGMPARKINVKAGQAWRAQDLMYSMLLVSANDAAVALAQKVGGGSLDGYVPLAGQTAARLGLTDHPVLNDPAGLDDEFSNKGGSRISAHDLAIVARAVLATPDIMSIIATRHYDFNGGDGIGHTLTNEDLLPTLYPGATGLKTGMTELAGHTFVGSATRNGRTMLAVVFGTGDPYGSAESLLDQGFATPVAAEVNLEHLPAVVPNAAVPASTTSTTEPHIALATAGPSRGGGGSLLNSSLLAFLVLILGFAGLVAVRRRTVVNRRRARTQARHAHSIGSHIDVTDGFDDDFDEFDDFEPTGAPR